MNSFIKEFVSLVSGAVKGEKIHVSESFDWDTALELAVRHNIVPMLFYSVESDNVPKNVMDKINSIFFRSLTVSENQIYYIKRISDAFEENGIDFVLLKGSVLKNMYPASDMRVMGDADILIKTEQYAKIKQTLEKIGFAEQKECDPEIIWNIHGLHLELHKSLFAKRNSDFYAYFGDGWENAVLINEKKHTYVLNPEASLVYLIAHLAKHMRNGGVGVRHITDIWIYGSKVKFDEKIVEKELEKLKLLEFYKNILKTINVWFNGAERDDTTDLITRWILSSGSFGTAEQYLLGNALKKKIANGRMESKGKLLLRSAFPPYSVMCGIYPVLRKIKLLLPFMYAVRIISRIIFKRGVMKDCINKAEISTEENVDAFHACMKKMGLNYDFKKNE